MSAPQSVVVGMATFRRPELLAALLPRLLEQIEHARSVLDPTPEFRIVVVDNDPEGSARDAASALGDCRIRYVVEATPGISSARNRVLDEAEDADVLVFIDDDETPHEGWLAHLLTAHRDYRADAVSGPVHAVFDGPEDPWVAASGAYVEPLREGTATGTVLCRAATNNLLLDLRAARRFSLRFDTRLGLTGGEDSLFTGQLTRAGGKIVWCAEAAVDDLVPADRNTRAFHLRRRRAQSATTVMVDRMLEPNRGARLGASLRWVIVGSGQIVKGAGQAGWAVIRQDLDARARGERRMVSGLGVLGGTLGVLSRPYSRAKT